MKLHWAGRDELDRVAEARTRSFSADGTPVEIEEDPRGTSWLLAEEDNVPVGTATSLSFTMWVRGAPLPCQGVADVGTIKTWRAGRGVASALMRELLSAARDREFALSALTPFRGSFYEHFGYGFAERRADWTIPTTILPRGDHTDLRFYQSDDLDPLTEAMRRRTERGQADIERLPPVPGNGFLVVDRVGDGPIRGWARFRGEQPILRVTEIGYDDASALRRILHLLASLRDEYNTVRLTTQADQPMHRLLGESQIVHHTLFRNHPTAEVRPYNRLQVRIIDHVRVLRALRLNTTAEGSTVVAIGEPEGNITTLQLDFSDGRVGARACSAEPDIECAAPVWAAVLLGDLQASRAADLGLITVHDHQVLRMLDTLAVGPAPFCHEHF
ncbi:GNAT family N-acetyltransferase [Nonomuraea sp. NPDC003754]